MEIKDLTRLKHMADSAGAILTFAKGRKRADLDKDRQFLSKEYLPLFLGQLEEIISRFEP